MLTSAARDVLRHVRTVIVDEVHALAGTKRGAHLALIARAAGGADGRVASRPDADGVLTGHSSGSASRPRSGPPERVARYLGGAYPVRVVAPPAEKSWDLSVVVPVEDMSDLAASAPPTPHARAWTTTDRRRRTAVDLAARGEPDPRPDQRPPLDHRVRQLPPTGRAADRSSQRAAGRAGRGRAEQARRRAARRYPPPAEIMAQSGVERRPRRQRLAPVVARAHHGSVSKEQRAQIEADLKSGSAALRGRHLVARAGHRHGCGRRRRAGRGPAVGGQRAAAGRPGRAPGRAPPRAACSSPTTAAT